MQHSQLIIGLVVSCGVLLAGCNTTAPEADPTDTSQVQEASVESVVSDTPSETASSTEMTIDAFKFAYSVEFTQVDPGEEITVTLTNSDGFHDFVIDELGVATKQINVGETDTVTFTIPEDATSGTTYEYYCSVANHRELGMVGKFVVR